MDLDEKLSLDIPDNRLISELSKLWEAHPNDESTCFQYAMVLSKSQEFSEKKKAVALLQNLSRSPNFRTDSLYTLGECYYSMGQYETARFYSEELLRQNPDNVQANSLHTAILEKQRNETAKTEETLSWIAFGVGIAAVAGMVLVKSLKK